MKLLSDEEMAQLLPAEEAAFASPIPTEIVSSDEYFPTPQSREQKAVEARLIELADGLARRQGMSRRRFFQTASRMAACFPLMNEIYGGRLHATPAEAAAPGKADQRAQA